MSNTVLSGDRAYFFPSNSNLVTLISSTSSSSASEVSSSSSSSSSDLAGSATTANFRTAVLVTANVTLASKVTFKANGKNLPGCKAKSTSGSGSSHSVTCIWKPSNRGAVLLSAIATSISAGISSPTAPQLNIRVDNRAGAR